ncbi:NAD(P)-dependent alcohol dehydrogenase [Christensenellaceae bacterium OttesenSCG-928-K19]|nr:NAD(P)-dependent alcohol dehydrogenase [Christensenellaceae bacterium OttesenSCG-928-K19]
MKMREAQKPEPGAGQVLIKIEYCGVCGSDVHYYEFGRVADYIVEGDFVLGHEGAGTVTEIGADVKNLKVGDRVALEPGYTCGKCEFCKSGRYNLCPDVIFFATPPVQGVLQEYVVHPADMCFKLPEHVSTKAGALAEPLAVGMHAARLGEVRLGDSCIILGAGCIGLMTLLAAKASGAGNIMVVDLYDNRLKLAHEFGATHVVNALNEDVDSLVETFYGGAGADIVFETAGSVKTIRNTPHYVKRGGTVVLVGMAAESEFSYDFGAVMFKEITLKSIFRYRNLYPAAIAAIASGAIDVEKIISHEFDFTECGNAFDTVIAQANDVTKAVIRF